MSFFKSNAVKVKAIGWDDSILSIEDTANEIALEVSKVYGKGVAFQVEGNIVRIGHETFILTRGMVVVGFSLITELECLGIIGDSYLFAVNS